MKYLESVWNLSRAVRAWRAASLILGAALIVSTIALAYQSISAPSYLVPYNFATTDKKVKVKPGEFVDKDYLTYVAIADLKLILDWTPSTVRTQYARFLKRTSPELFKSQEITLMNEAKAYSSGSISQVFHPNKTSVAENTVTITGRLYRWEGEIQTIKSDTSYVLTYRENGGIPYVEELNIQ